MAFGIKHPVNSKPMRHCANVCIAFTDYHYRLQIRSRDSRSETDEGLDFVSTLTSNMDSVSGPDPAPSCRSSPSQVPLKSLDASPQGVIGKD